MRNVLKKLSIIMICIMCTNLLQVPIGLINKDIKVYAETSPSSANGQVGNIKQLKGPSDIRCESETSNSITLAWDALNEVGVVGYDIYISSKKVGKTNGETRYTVKGLTPNTKYKMYVKTRDKAGNISSENNFIEIMTTEEQTVADAPDNQGNVCKPETLIYVENQDFSNVLEGNVEITGTCLSNDDYWDHIKIFIDDIDRTDAIYNLQTHLDRKDSQQKYTMYKNSSKSGFSFILDTYVMANGEHKLKLMFDESSREFTIKVNNINWDMVVESPNVVQNQQGVINIKGYIISSYDPSQLYLYNCHVFADGKEMYNDNLNFSFESGQAREDIKLKNPNYKYAANCGFSFKADIMKLSNGKHTIKIKLESLEKEFTINVQNTKSEMIIDGNYDTQEQKGITNISGYILGSYNPDDLEGWNFDVYVDDSIQWDFFEKTLDFPIDRPDVKRQYPNYVYANKCGFSYALDTLKFSNGKHKIKIQLLSLEKEFTINIQNKDNDIVIEGIDENQGLEGIVSGQGYVFSSYDPSGFDVGILANCELFIDNVLQRGLFEPTLQVQIPRPDIKQKLPGYKYADKCGFTFNFDTVKFTNGKHTLKIKIKELVKEVTININNKPNNLVIESTSTSTVDGGKFVISGYLLSTYSPEQLQNRSFMLSNSKIEVDGEYFGSNVTVGIKRDDIKDRNPDYKYSGVSGFCIEIDNDKLAKLAVGTHRMDIIFRSISKGFSFKINPKSSVSRDFTFNSKFYADKYPDLKNTFGYNEEALYNHWINNGVREGRCASPIFDVKYYLNNNIDLKKAFGENKYELAFNHFVNQGYGESRKLSPIFDVKYYIENNKDLQKFFSYDAIMHFKNFGIKEIRATSADFNIQIYMNKYKDLRAAYSDNIESYYSHYVAYGYDEGRNCK